MGSLVCAGAPVTSVVYSGTRGGSVNSKTDVFQLHANSANYIKFGEPLTILLELEDVR